MKTGFISVIGRANVGKSTLVNAMTGMKVAITSPKPQTTRDKISGILTAKDYQLVFVDTPGIHEPSNKLGRHMQKQVSSAVSGADAALIVVDGAKGLTEYDMRIIEKYKNINVPLFCAVNKCDAATDPVLFPTVKSLSDMAIFKDVLMLSAKTGKNVPLLIETLAAVMPQGEKMYGDDEYTDKTERQIIAEIVREKILLYIQQEVPHGIHTEVELMDSSQNVVKISVLIVCEKPGHKSIIIGKNGEMLKKIGESARKSIESFLERKVFLQTFVKVSKDWRDNLPRLKDMGYTDQ